MNRRSLLSIAAALLVASALAGCSGSKSGTTLPGGAHLAKGQILIRYEGNAQVEIQIPSGHRILIDVWDKASLSAPPSANDILLTTHSHDDHYVAPFVDAFPGKKLTFEVGPLHTSEFDVTGISTVHDDGLADGSDFIYVIDVAGFRIVHFGDFGASKLTDAQLAAIGNVDVAISQLANSFSSMDEINRKGINQMNQVKPKILIPTHLSSATATEAAAQWSATYSTHPLTLSRDRLPATTTICFMGDQASSLGSLLKLSPASW